MKKRILFGILAGCLFLCMLYLGGYWFTAFIMILALLGYREFVRLNGFSTVNLQAIVGYLILIGLIFPWQQLFPGADLYFIFSLVSWSYLLFLLIVTVLSKNKLNIEHSAIYLLSIVYLALGFKYMVETIWMQDGQIWALVIFATIWATDTGAYFAGVLFGKHPLVPDISPKKTIEGSVGGVMMAIAIGIVFSLLFPDLFLIHEAIAIAFVIAVLAQFGDLIQSAYKRHRNVKDSGTILPGHGGILDRTDSWIIVFPFLHLIFFHSGWLGV